MLLGATVNCSDHNRIWLDSMQLGHIGILQAVQGLDLLHQQAPRFRIFGSSTCQLSQKCLSSLEIPKLCIGDTSALQSLKIGSIAGQLGLILLRLLCQLSLLICTQLPDLLNITLQSPLALVMSCFCSLT